MENDNLPIPDRLFERLFGEFNRLSGKNAEQLAQNADAVFTMTGHLIELGRHTLNPRENIGRVAAAIEEQVGAVLALDEKGYALHHYMRAGVLSSAANSAFAAMAALEEKSDSTLSLKPAAKGPAV